MSSDSEVELDDAAAPEDDDTESDFSEAEASITEEESEGSDFGDEENENPKKDAKGKAGKATSKKGGAKKPAPPAPTKNNKSAKAGTGANKKRKGAAAPKRDSLSSLPKKQKRDDTASVASTTSAGSKKPAKTAKSAGKNADKPAPVSEAEAPSLVLDYVNKQNRPYSTLNIFENLHGVVKKAALQRVLDKLADEGKIHAKTYGKSKVYYPDQEQYGQIQENDIKELQDQSKELATQQNDVKSERKKFEQQLNSLQSSLTTDQLKKTISELKEDIASKEAKLERLNEQSGGEVVDKNTRKNIISEINKYRKIWVDRKNKVMDVVDNMSEGTGKKPREITEEAGLETDEEMGVNPRDFKIQP